MKVILVGSTGFVGGEVLRLALKNPKIKEVVALSRREITIPEGYTPEEMLKYKYVEVADFGQDYPENIKEKMKGANACIWNMAVGPKDYSSVGAEKSKEICHDYTMVGLKAMAEVAGSPFRFVYTSGSLTERDQDKSLWVMSDYRHMRGEVENAVLDFGSNSSGKLQVQVTKPGMIESATQSYPLFKPVLEYTIGLQAVHVKDLAAAEIEQAVNGLEKDVLENEDLVRIGLEALKGYNLPDEKS